MKSIYDRFAEFLKNEDKAGAVRYALELLESGSIAVSDLYEMILGPVLNQFHCPENDESCIWREHVRTSIVRAIVEIAYPYVLKAKEAPGFVSVGKKALVVCPPEEYHEIGARMAADFFELAGFEVKFVGANTPVRDILAAVRFFTPDVVALGVTNYYNLVKTYELVERIRAERPDVRIALGGNAFRDPSHVKCVGCGDAVQSFRDIVALGEKLR
ncbi:MAG: cobalamin-dependent protein [Candidatus Izemoplasmatales bacterium]